jgi:uncharacterized protein (UPF0335 family)
MTEEDRATWNQKYKEALQEALQNQREEILDTLGGIAQVEEAMGHSSEAKVLSAVIEVLKLDSDGEVGG